jgi:DNA polymerase III alpha subunit
MFLAIIRPAKRHLAGKTWKEVGLTVWDKVEGEYAFKRSHSCAYAQLVVVNMNLLAEQQGM